MQQDLVSLLMYFLIYNIKILLRFHYLRRLFSRAFKYVIKRQCASFYPDVEGPAFGLGVWWAGSLEAIFILPFLDKIIFHPSMWREAEVGKKFDGVRDWVKRTLSKLGVDTGFFTFVYFDQQIGLHCFICTRLTKDI